MAIRLGIFELGTSRDGDDIEIIENTIDLAKIADRLGYRRFWLGEHQEAGVAWRSPEILMAVLAGYTNEIRIGAAGVLLALNSPLRVAQNFKMLSSLFSNRIDLGIARGFTNNTIAKELLNGLDHNVLLHDHIPRTRHLLNYFNNVYLNLDGTEDLIVNAPNNGSLPDIWMLGSSGATTEFSINEKLNFALSLLHVPKENYNKSREIFISYLNKYEEVNKTKAQANITLSVVCGKTKKHRETILKSLSNKITANVIGDVEECFDKVNAICNDFKSSEVMLHIMSPTAKEKVLCVEQFAKKFGL